MGYYKQIMGRSIVVKYMKEEDPLVFWEGEFFSDKLSGKYKLETPEALHKNETLLIRFYIRNSFSYAEAKVKVLESIKEQESSLFQAGIEFIQISTSLLEKIT